MKSDVSLAGFTFHFSSFVSLMFLLSWSTAAASKFEQSIIEPIVIDV